MRRVGRVVSWFADYGRRPVDTGRTKRKKAGIPSVRYGENVSMPCIAKTPKRESPLWRPVSALRRLVLQFPDPDIAETDRVQVVLQHDRAATVGDRFREADEFRRAEDQRVVLDQHAVVQHGDPSVRVQRTVVLEPGRRVDDVVGVPFAPVSGRR